jgi:hypothetical protein
VATFVQQATAHLQAREENSGLTVRAYAPRSKFSTGLRADETAAVAHVYLPADFPSKVRSAAADEATVEPRSSTASLQAVRVCLPGTCGRILVHAFSSYWLLVMDGLSCRL